MRRVLLVIDVQNDYFPGGVLPLWQAEATEARIVSAIGRAREAGDGVVLVRHIAATPDGLFAANSPGIEIRPVILDASEGAPVVTKQFADAFQDTDLADRLEGVENLLICGMMTQNCVAFTALSRAADGMRVTVLPDLCTAPTELVHTIAASALAAKVHVSEAAEMFA